MKDLANMILLKTAIAAIAVADNTAQVGTAIDRAGYDSVTYAISTGVLADADATFDVLLEESDVFGSGYTTVAAADLISQNPAQSGQVAADFTFAADGAVRKLGYIGNKRYTRMTITPSANASSAPISAIAILGHPDMSPVVQTAS